MESDHRVACSLSSGDATSRQQQWDQLLQRATSQTASADGLRVEFGPDPDTRTELARLVQLERECCPFLDLKIEDKPGRGPVLSASAPPEAQPILRQLLSAPP